MFQVKSEVRRANYATSPKTRYWVRAERFQRALEKKETLRIFGISRILKIIRLKKYPPPASHKYIEVDCFSQTFLERRIFF